MLNSELIYNSYEHKGYTVNWYYDQDPESPREWSNISEIDSWNKFNSYADYNFSDRSSAIEDLLDRYTTVDKIGEFLIEGKGDAKLVITPEDECCEVAIYNGNEKESCYVDIIPEGTELDYWNAYCEEQEDNLLHEVATMISLYDLRDILKDSVNVYGLCVNDCGVSTELNDNPMYYSSIDAIVFITKETALKEFGKVNESTWYERAERCILGEMNDFNSYVIGDVYGYQILDQSGNEIDSCFGFVGCGSIEDEDKNILSFIEYEVKKDNQFKEKNSKVLKLVDKIKNVLAPEGYSLELVKLAN